MSAAPPITQTRLQDAFDAFIRAAGRLEHTHRELHDEVSILRLELEDRNRALVSSLAENETIRAELHEILDTLPCGVLVLESAKKEIALANPEAMKMLELQSSTPSWAQLPQSIQTLIEHVTMRGLDGDEREICLSRKNGECWLSVRHKFVSVPAGDNMVVTERSVLIIRDITADKRLLHEREASRNQIALSEMASVLAHEIRNPLATLELMTTVMIEDPALGSESKRCVRHLQAGIRSLSATVNNTLTFHSPGLAHLSRVQAGAALRSAAEFVRPLAEQNEVHLLITEKLGNAEIEATSSGLQQIILNLACNALRHTKAGSTIEIRGYLGSDKSGRTAIVEFSDDGSGIHPTYLPHIFHAGFSGEKKGLGLGLAVCKQIMEQHGGNISVRSTLGHGTTFRLEFPLA